MAQRDAGARISPASMTKILTILVAAEHITNPDDMVEITRDIADYSFSNECSVAGFEVGEKVSVRDLFMVLFFRQEQMQHWGLLSMWQVHRMRL